MTQILNSTTLYQDKYLHIKCDEIKLNNGNIGKFEYIDSINPWDWAVVIVPVDEHWYFYLVSMFQVGSGIDTITFPKWYMPAGEDPCQRANLELQEEVWLSASKLISLGSLYSHPWWITWKHNIILAQWLSVSKLEWDEIETIEILKLTQDEVKTMIMNWTINDAKTIASFYMATTYLSNN